MNLRRLLGKRPAPEPTSPAQPDHPGDAVTVVTGTVPPDARDVTPIQPGVLPERWRPKTRDGQTESALPKPKHSRRPRESRIKHGSKFTDFVVGGLEIAAGIAIAVFAPPALAGYIAAISGLLIAGGAGFVFSGVGTLLEGNNQPGLAWSSRNPVKPWDIVYGQTILGGTLALVHGNHIDGEK